MTGRSQQRVVKSMSCHLRATLRHFTLPFTNTKSSVKLCDVNSALDVLLSALTAFAIVAGGSIITVVASQPGGTGALNKTAWIVSGAVGLVAAAKDVRSLLKLPPVPLSVKPPVKEIPKV